MSEMDKKNTIYIGIILVVLLITCAFSFTFAFIGGATGNGNINVIGNVLDASEALTLSYFGDTDLSLNITLDDLNVLKGSNDYSSYIEDTATVNVSLTYDPNFFPNGVTCYYSAQYVPENNYKYTPSVESVNNGLKELSILRASYGGEQYTEHTIEADNNIMLFENNNIVATSGSTTTIPWTFKLRFYNLGVDQSDVIGQTPSGKIKIIPGECEKM